ncbi:MAG: TolC family protein [Elusimicrobiales bacterium]|jgi:outer membrane protein TolC
MNKILLPALAVLSMALPSRAQTARTQDVLSLEDVVSLAVKNNPTLLASEQDIIIAKQRVREARFMNLPQFALSGTFSKVNLEYPMILGPELGDRYLDPAIKENFYTMRAYALQPLYTGGRNKNTLRLAQTAHNQAQVNYETVRTDVVYNAKKVFYTLLLNKKLRELALERGLRARALNDGIRKNAWEEIEARILLSGFEKQAEQAAHEADAYRIELLRVLNREPSYQVDITGDLSVRPVGATMQKSLVTAMEMRSELKSEIYKAQMDDIAVNMAMIRRYPNVYLGASYDVIGYNVNSLSENSIRSNNWAASIAIHFPLSYDIWTQVIQRRAQQRQGDLKRVELQDKIRFEILTAHKDLEFWAAETRKRTEILAAVESEYGAAAKKTPASLSALRSLSAMYELEKTCLEGVYQQLLARVKLEWAQGRDLEE